MSTDNVTPIQPARQYTDGDNAAKLAISNARAIADAIYAGTTGRESPYLEELGNLSVNALMHQIIAQLDRANRLIAQDDDSTEDHANA